MRAGQRRSGVVEYWALPLGNSLEIMIAMQGAHLVVALCPSREPQATVERALSRPIDSLARSDVLSALRQRYDI